MAIRAALLTDLLAEKTARFYGIWPPEPGHLWWLDAAGFIRRYSMVPA